ncbi:MAG: FAD-dependent monooxygenase, partial [Deltaproteobacteria bacterium]|nr:FAD-dependent monooxygenase [Deltaproteobacteria bacterium]
MGDGAEFEIVGGGLAGLAAAAVLARAGGKVRVLEKRRYPCVKLCGEFLSPEGLAALARVSGVEASSLVRELGARALSKFAWRTRAGRTLELELAPRGWAVRRDILDLWLARRAEALGAEVRFGTAVEGPLDSGARALWAVGKEHSGLKSPFFAVKGYADDAGA